MSLDRQSHSVSQVKEKHSGQVPGPSHTYATVTITHTHCGRQIPLSHRLLQVLHFTEWYLKTGCGLADLAECTVRSREESQCVWNARPGRVPPTFFEFLPHFKIDPRGVGVKAESTVSDAVYTVSSLVTFYLRGISVKEFGSTKASI